MADNKPAVKLIEGSAKIGSLIDSIANRGKKLDADIQRAALSVMAHHSQHGDVTLINRLVASMPKGSRVNALMRYIETFGAVRWDKDKKEFVHAKGKKFDLEAASARTWHEFKPDPQYKPIDDPFQSVNALIKTLERDMQHMGDQSKVDPSLIEALRAAKSQALETIGNRHAEAI